MSATVIALISIGCLLVLVLAGVHISFSLGILSFLTIWVIKGSFPIAISILATTAFSGIRQYTFAVVPLFVLMGCFMSRSGVAKDLFDTMNYGLKRIPGGMGIATVISNAVFAAVTGVSVASAAVFSKISLPAMKSYNYDKHFALGTVAGSSVLGMLIPPSLLFIVYGTISETSIGKLFIAGVIPGILLATIYSAGIIIMSSLKPQLVGGEMDLETGKYRFAYKKAADDEKFLPVFLRALPIFIIVIIVLGGIWVGIFTPTEASAVGALLTMLLSFYKGMRWKELKNILLEAGGTTASIMFLLINAQMYSRMLALSGVTVAIGKGISNSGWSNFTALFVICVMWVILGCVLDSTSILLITVPLVLPIAAVFGWDLIWLGVIAVIVIEMGLLTPPFGMVVFAMKASVADEDVNIEGIFRSSLPFILMMILAVLIIVAFPELATWLPG